MRWTCGLVADVTGATLEEIVALNPSLLRMTTPGTMDFDLHVPVGTKDAYVERIKQIPEEKRASWRFHVVRSGESLDGIATALHTKPSEIATLTAYRRGQGLAIGDELVIPVATVAGPVHVTRYTVRERRYSGNCCGPVQCDGDAVAELESSDVEHVEGRTAAECVGSGEAAPATRVSARKRERQ